MLTIAMALLIYFDKIDTIIPLLAAIAADAYIAYCIACVVLGIAPKGWS